jgi:hypothetical protein
MYAFTLDVPIDATTYRRIRDGLGDEPPDGLVVHLAIARPEGGLTYVDVWASRQQADRFTEERLHPVVHAMLREVFGDELPPEPERREIDVVHAWGPGPS